jgi:hypothetical protein
MRAIPELNRNLIGFINASNKIHEFTNNNNVTKQIFWTATQNCWCEAWVSAHTDGSYIGMVYLDGITVARNANAYDISVVFPVKKGQTISKENGNVTCRFYSMI